MTPGTLNFPPKRSNIDESVPSIYDYLTTYSDVMYYADNNNLVPPVSNLTSLKSQIGIWQNCVDNPNSRPWPNYPDAFYQNQLDIAKNELAEMCSDYEFAFRYTGQWMHLHGISVSQAGVDPANLVASTNTVTFSEDETTDMSYELGFSATVGTGDISPVKLEATISASFGQSFEHTTSFSNETSTTIDTPSFTSNQACIVDLWQRIGSFQVVYRQKGGTDDDWLPMGSAAANTSNFTGVTICPEDAATPSAS